MKVTALTIWDATDANSTSSLHTTNQGAYQELVNWVEGMWDDAGIGRDIGTFQSNIDRVTYFFHIRKEDYQYKLERKEVYGPAVAKDGSFDPNEVCLYPKEIEVTIFALENSRPAEMSIAINSSRDTCQKLAENIIKKLKD